MADRDETEKATSEQPAGETPAVKPELKAEALPSVESPSISPATPEAPAVEPVPADDSPIAPARAATPLRLTLRRRRMALLAASVTIATAVGAIIGAVTASSLSGSHQEVAGLQERKAMQQSIARLGSELTTLKSSLESASKSAHAQTAQLEKLNHALNEKLAAASKANAALAQANDDVTGSISAPQTTTAAGAVTPLPQPRPQQLAALDSPVAAQPPMPTQARTVSQPRPLVVPDWRVRGTARGTVLVEGHGEIYEVVPGANLPGLGRIQSIRRVDGRWIVETPKGLIVSSLREPRYFE